MRAEYAIVNMCGQHIKQTLSKYCESASAAERSTGLATLWYGSPPQPEKRSRWDLVKQQI
jgi:hypothetical protein